MRTCLHGIFAGCDSVEFFVTLLHRRSKAFAILPAWWVPLEPLSPLLVPSPLESTNYTSYVLSSSASERDDFWRAALSEFVVFSSVMILGVTRYAAWQSRQEDTRTLADGLYVLVALHQWLIEFI